MQKLETRARLGKALLAMALCLTLGVGFTQVAPTTQAWADDGGVNASANVYDEAKASTLTSNLVARFTTGDYKSITKDSFYAAISVNALNCGDALDVAEIKANLASELDSISSGALAKYILALTAAGIDCTNCDGVNLVAQMESLMTGSESVYSAVVILPVYQVYADENGKAATLKQQIIDAQDARGLFEDYGWTDVQTPAQAVLALAAYKDEPAVATFISKAVTGMKALQCEDGGFPNYTNASDVDTTGNVVAALVAVGENVLSADYKTTSGSDPLGYLLSQADATLDGYASDYNKQMATADAFVAFAAVQAQKNVYDLDVAVFRLYNAATSEHLYTSDLNEATVLPSLGWTYEGIAWNSPVLGKDVYRLYNPVLGDHHYTSDANEVSELVAKYGWVKEGDGSKVFYSAETSTGAIAGACPIYRLYNSALTAGQHHFTTDVNEYNVLPSFGWAQENVAFYALS